MARSASRWRQNAMRSGLIVIGAVAFGYLSLEVGFKPFLERAQEASQRSESAIREPDSIAEEENHYYKKDEILK